MIHWCKTIRKALKTHICESCGRSIDKGEKYDRTFAIDGGDTWVYKECVHCAALVNIWCIWDYCDASEGYTLDTFHEYRDEIRTITDARLWAQWHRKWRRGDGTLFPVPEPAKVAA